MGSSAPCGAPPRAKTETRDTSPRAAVPAAAPAEHVPHGRDGPLRPQRLRRLGWRAAGRAARARPRRHP
eukprot:1817176-Prymnesium_polylepis.1